VGLHVPAQWRRRAAPVDELHSTANIRFATTGDLAKNGPDLRRSRNRNLRFPSSRNWPISPAARTPHGRLAARLVSLALQSVASAIPPEWGGLHGELADVASELEGCSMTCGSCPGAEPLRI
jgi:hypothetical protein